MKYNDIIKFMSDLEVGYLATINKNVARPSVRPLSFQFYKGDIFFSTNNDTSKINELASCPAVEILFRQEDKQVRLVGHVEQVMDESIQGNFLKEYPFLSQIFEGENRKKFTLFRVIPEMVKMMLNDELKYVETQWDDLE